MRLHRDDGFVAHIFTTAVIAGLCTISVLSSEFGQKTSPFVWYASCWPYTPKAWAILLGCTAIVGAFGAAVMAGLCHRNKYLILASTTAIAAAHAHVAQSIWESYHLATGVSTYPLIFLLSLWVFWLTSTDDG